MNELVEVVLDQKITKNPKALADMILELAEDIEECKDDLEAIRSRGLFKRLFSNTTRDLADLMIRQNDTISLFLNIVQGLIMLNMYNTAMLGAIQDELCKHEASRGSFQNKYLAMAREYISQSYSAAVTLKGQIDKQHEALDRIREQMVLKNRLDEEQSQLIAQIRERATKHDEVDQLQDQLLVQIQEELAEKTRLDEHQSAMLSALQMKLAASDQALGQQGKAIEDLGRAIANLQDQMDGVRARLEEIAQQYLKSHTEMCRLRRQSLVGYSAIGVAVIAATVAGIML